MMYIIQFLSRRYLMGTAHTPTVATMVKICFASIAIGSCALALVVSVMNGFEQVTHQKMRGVHADIIVHQPGHHLDAAGITNVLTREFPEIKATTPSAAQHVIIQAEDDTNIDNVVVIKGIEPRTEGLVSGLEKKLLAPQPNLTALLELNRIIIGKKLAQQLNVDIGQEVTLMYVQDNQSRKNKVNFTTKKARVSGIFSMGIEEMDSHIIYCSLNFLHQLFPDADVTHLNIALKPGSNDEDVAQRIRKRLSLNAYTWKEMYPALVSALKLEKYAMFFILVLITLVASMNIMALLFMQITQKRSEIAILKTLGLSHRALRMIFLFLGTGIAVGGSIAGLTAAFIIGSLLDRYPFITLPDVYYVTHLPIAMSADIFIIVFVVVTLISMLSSWLPTRHMASINIANILRFES